MVVPIEIPNANVQENLLREYEQKFVELPEDKN